MKRLAILTSLVAAGLVSAGLHAQGQPLLGDIEQVSERIWTIYGEGGNTTVFVLADGVALVDTKLAGNGAAILAQVRKITDKPVALIVNTHSHGDHVGSNAELDPRGEIEVVAHVNTSRRMAAMDDVGAAKRTFDDRLTLGDGADRIELYWFGAGHTDGDAFVVFPAERTVATGDIFQRMAMTGIDRNSGGSALALPVTLSEARDTIKGVDKVIDGHGDKVRSWEEFGTFVDFTRALIEAARNAQRTNGTPEQALASLEANASLRPFLDPGQPSATVTGRGQALRGLTTAMQELRGEPPAPPTR